MESISKKALLLLSAVGTYTTVGLFVLNGSIKHLTRVFNTKPQVLPGSQYPLKTLYTGILPVDIQLIGMSALFWEVLDGSHPSASLFFFYFGGQLVACWGLLYMEGARNAHRGKFLSRITLLGFATQNASFAVVTPIWLAHHLSTSPTISSRETDDLAIDLHKLASIPLSIIGGFVIPSFVLSLLVPKIVSSETKQIFIAVWQYFPFAIGLFQQILPGIMSNAFGIASQSSASGKKISPQSLPALRAVYCTFLIFAGISHIATITLVTTSQLFPMLFSPQCKGVFNFTKMFKPAGITGFTKMSALHPGMHQLLQYDFTVGAAAMVIWATTLWLKTGRKELSFLRSGGFFIGLMVLLGPIGAATASVWLRDEAIFAETVKRSKKES